MLLSFYIIVSINNIFMCTFVAVSQISDDGNDDSGGSGGLTTVSLVVIIIVIIIVLTTLVIIIVGVGVYCHRKLRFVHNN